MLLNLRANDVAKSLWFSLRQTAPVTPQAGGLELLGLCRDVLLRRLRDEHGGPEDARAVLGAALRAASWIQDIALADACGAASKKVRLGVDLLRLTQLIQVLGILATTCASMQEAGAWLACNLEFFVTTEVASVH